MTVKEQLHHVVDAMTEAEAHAALRALAETSRDPVAWVIAHAPVDDEPDSDEERGAVEETKRELAAGERTVALEEVKRDLGLA